MHPQLQKAFTRSERQRLVLLDSLSKVSTADLNKIPAPGKWSASEIIAHLIVAERLSIAYMKKKIQGVEQVDDSGWREEMKMLLLQLSQRVPGLKFKAPHYIVENTPSFTDFESLKSEWDKTRDEFREFLKSISEKHIKRKIYKHARVGYLNVQHAIIFFGEHVTHHATQIRKLTKRK